MVIVRSDSSVLSIARQILVRAMAIIDVLEARRQRAAEAAREIVETQRGITATQAGARPSAAPDAAPSAPLSGRLVN